MNTLKSVTEIPITENTPWTGGLTVMHADLDCKACKGLGSVKSQPCLCVLREIFSRVFTAVSESSQAIGSNPFVNIDYRVDFDRLVKRVLNTADQQILNLFHTFGLPGHEVASRLHMTKSQVFHSIYRIEAKIGRALVEQQPVALYPFSRYFQTTKGARVVSFPAPTANRAANILRPPLAVSSAA